MAAVGCFPRVGGDVVTEGFLFDDQGVSSLDVVWVTAAVTPAPSQPPM